MPLIPELFSAPVLERIQERRRATEVGACIPLAVLRDTIQPVPTFSEIYLALLKALHEEIARRREPVGAGLEEAAR
jgi:hypothetical protein